jgi:hypothetical protein
MTTTTDWIVAIGTIVMAVVAVIAVFQDRIRAWLSRPILNASIALSPPDCHKTELHFVTREEAKASRGSSKKDQVEVSRIADVYYFRLRIANSGNDKAESVEVIASDLTRRLADGTYKVVESFLPMNLAWTHIHTLFFPAISPGTYKHCDLFHIIDPKTREIVPMEGKTWPHISRDKTILSFDTVVQPFTKNYLVCVGVYRLTLIVAAANSKPITKILEINLTGDWFDEEQKMLGEGIGIKVIS